MKLKNALPRLPEASKPNMRLPAIPFIFLFISCSFNYQDLPEQTTVRPDMTFVNVTLKRYNNASTNLNVYAEELEMYDEEKIWAGKNISFVQYDEKNQKVSMKGETGILYIDEKSEEYFLGKTVFFHLIEDDFSVYSPALVWKKKEYLLAAPSDETVKITRKDELSIEGKNFAAHTAAKTFTFAGRCTGTIVIR